MGGPPSLLELHTYIFVPLSQHQSHHPEDGGKKILLNVVILPQHHISSQPGRPLSPILLFNVYVNEILFCKIRYAQMVMK